MSSYDQIRAQLRHLRRWWALRRALGAAAGSAWITALAVTLGAVLLGLWMSPVLRTALWLAWAAALAAILVTDALLPILGHRRDESLAQLLERHHPPLRNDLTSSLQFGHLLARRDAAAIEVVGSPALMRALVQQTADRMAKHATRLQAELPRAGRPLLVRSGLVAAALALSLFFALPGTFRPGLRYLVLGTTPATAEAALAPSAQEPLVARIEVSYRYPAYTGRGPVHLVDPSGRIDVLAGTEVRLRALALVPATSASLLVLTGPPDGQTVETRMGMTVTGRDLAVTFTPMQSARYTFELTDPNGQVQRDPVQRVLAVTPDASPLVHVTAPDGVVEAGANDVVPFHFTVSDDFGLTELAFVHTFGEDSTEEQREVLATLNGDLVMEDSAGFDLAPLNLQPRDEVTVYVEAMDNDTISGPKAGRSQPVVIRIASPEDRHLALVDREDAVYEALLDVLGDYLEHPISDMHVDNGQLSFELADLSPAEYGTRFANAQQISNKVQDLLTGMRDLLTQLQSDELLLQRDFGIVQSIYDHLYGLHRDEQNVIVSLDRPATHNTLTRAHMQRLDTVRTQQVHETEQSILSLEDLVAAQRMDSAVRTLEELDQIQSRLRQLLQQYRDTQDPALRADIERELMRLEARMHELMQRLAEQMDRVPPEHYNLQALQEMGQMPDVSNMADALEQLRQAIESGDIDSALAQLDSLSSQLDSLRQQMAASEESGDSGLSQLDQRLSELMDQINDIEGHESQLEQDTGALQEEIRQRRAAALESQLDQFVQQARQRVADMRQALSGVDRGPLRSTVRDALSEADHQLESLDDRLQAQDFESALERAQSALEQLSQAGLQLSSQARHYPADSQRGQAVAQARDQVGGVGQDAQQLANDLHDLLDQARPTPDASDQPRLQQLGQSQDQALQALQQLLQRVQEMGQDMPMIGDQLGTPLQQVQGFMQGAGAQLQAQRLQDARDEEQSALRLLRDLREQMHQMAQQQRMGARDGAQSVERVEIPDQPDETPAEFREDLLNAMREGSLQSYEEAIRRYYESLVQ